LNDDITDVNTEERARTEQMNKEMNQKLDQLKKEHEKVVNLLTKEITECDSTFDKLKK